MRSCRREGGGNPHRHARRRPLILADSRVPSFTLRPGRRLSTPHLPIAVGCEDGISEASPRAPAASVPGRYARSRSLRERRCSSLYPINTPVLNSRPPLRLRQCFSPLYLRVGSLPIYRSTLVVCVSVEILWAWIYVEQTEVAHSSPRIYGRSESLSMRRYICQAPASEKFSYGRSLLAYCRDLVLSVD
jgi:hypothetical protein